MGLKALLTLDFDKLQAGPWFFLWVDLDDVSKSSINMHTYQNILIWWPNWVQPADLGQCLFSYLTCESSLVSLYNSGAALIWMGFKTEACGIARHYW